MSERDANIIERREFKYLVDAATAAELRAAIRPFCELDPWAAKNPRGRYTIESVYFDTASLRLFWANDAEQVDRVKVRVRGYAEAPAAPVFFEVKRRVNDVILKTRGKVPRDAWQELVSLPETSIDPRITGKDRRAVERFLAISRSMHLQPLTVVRYEREPYFSLIDDYARVTFDTAIRAQSTTLPTFDLPTRGWRALDDAVTQKTLASLIVVELKFTTYVPLWLVRIVGKIGLVRRSFSKYGTSIRAFYEQPSLRRAAIAGGWG